MYQGGMNKAFDYCADCLYLNEKLQAKYQSDICFMLPFCTYYNLHFASVRQIDQCSDTCLHHDTGHI